MRIWKLMMPRKMMKMMIADEDNDEPYNLLGKQSR